MAIRAAYLETIYLDSHLTISYSGFDVLKIVQIKTVQLFDNFFWEDH